MMYPYACDECGEHVTLIRSVAERDAPLACDNCGKPMARQFVADAAVHYRAFGFTRGPAIMRDPIAKGHPGQKTNWGTQADSDFTNAPQVDDPTPKEFLPESFE